MPGYDFRSPRLYVDAPLGTGAAVTLEPAQAHYLTHVLRLKSGAGVLVFNGRDGEWAATIEPQRRSALLHIGALARAQTAPADLHYLFAPLKAARLDYMVQKAVEMGVAKLQPVLTRHTQAARVNTERMRANAVEAAEQCGILSVLGMSLTAAAAPCADAGQACQNCAILDFLRRGRRGGKPDCGTVRGASALAACGAGRPGRRLCR